MNILFLFGHDHSRGETEFILTEGDKLICPTDSVQQKTKELTLDFTYAQSGYLSTVIGIADAHYSFIYRNGDDLAYELFHAGSSEYIRHTDIPLRNIKLLSSGSSSPVAKTDNKIKDSPKTSASFRITPFLIISLCLVLISRKRKK